MIESTMNPSISLRWLNETEKERFARLKSDLDHLSVPWLDNPIEWCRENTQLTDEERDLIWMVYRVMYLIEQWDVASAQTKNLAVGLHLIRDACQDDSITLLETVSQCDSVAEKGLKVYRDITG